MIKLIKTEEFEDEVGLKKIRKLYGEDENHITGVVEEPKEHQTEPIISEQEELNAEILLNQASIIAKQEEQDEVLAEILLNQTGGEGNV